MMRVFAATALIVGLSASLAGCRGGPSAAIPPAMQNARGALVPRTPGQTVPYYTSTFRYGGQTYTYAMVGTNPRASGSTTTVTAVVVPVRLTFPNGAVLDGSTVAPYVLQSPLFATAKYYDGVTQYGDAIMRAEFWKWVHAKPYHVLLSAAPLAQTVSLSVPSGQGYTTGNNAAVNGYVAFSWFVQTIEPQVIAQLGIPPTDLTIFVTAQTDVLEEGGYCCYRGYHESFTQSAAGGTATWTTAWASVTKSSVSTLSHEVAEWLNDPFYNNYVPAWIQPESGACGGRLLEVGDPVTKHRFRVNGFNVQDEAFYSWFARQKKSIGYHRRYDFAGDLHAPAANCT